MTEFLIYLLKSAGLLSLFYLVFQMLLKNDTSFRWNRIFLLSGIFVAALFPAISFTNNVFVDVPTYLFDFQSTATIKNVLNTKHIDWWQISGIIYFGIFFLFFFRLMFQFFSILKLFSRYRKTKFGNLQKIITNQEISPFSFFNVIVFNPSFHAEKELELILKHEKVHADQKHSFDILLAHLLTAVLWFNPLSWLYKKNIEQNLEYLADREATHDLVSTTIYQKALVSTSIKRLTPTLSNNFYQSSIKKRIIMLNKKSNSKKNLFKMTAIFPLLLAFMVLFNVKVHAQVNPDKSSNKIQVSSENKMGNRLIIVNDEVKDENFNLNSISTNQIASINVLKGNNAIKKYGKKGENGAIEITLKNGEQTSSGEKNDSSEAYKIDNLTNVLIVVNGKIMKDDYKVASIEREKISAVNVLKGENAVKKYGEKGKNGVIEIMLKKKKNK